MGAGNLPDEGVATIYDNHWRLMVKEGRAVVADLGEPGDHVKTVQAVEADRADEHVDRLEAQRAALVTEIAAAKADAKAKRALAKETGDQAQKRAKADAAARQKKEADAVKKARAATDKVKAAAAEKAEADKAAADKGKGK